VRIRRAQALRENVRDAGAFHDGADRAAGNHAGAGRCRLHENFARTVLSNDFVRNRAARERDLHHVATRRVDRLTDGLRDFVRLAGREPDLALTVTDGHECVEREAASALHDLRDAIDRDDVFDELAALAATTTIVAAATSDLEAQVT